jgi:DNA polymerase kappa
MKRQRPTENVRNPYAKQQHAPSTSNTASHDSVAVPDLVVAASSSNSPVVQSSYTATASALVIAASYKAGMEGMDRSRVDAIILRESGQSLYMRQQRERDAKVNDRIAILRHKVQEQELTGKKWRVTIKKELELKEAQLVAQRPLRSTCVVVDMDMFYMACELLTRPDLRDKPACVGHTLITTSNYCARKYGVRSAMAGYIGDKLVHELSGGKERLHHVSSNFPLYKEKSEIVRQVLSQYDPRLRSYSLDEAYMDIGPYLATKLLHPDWSHKQISAYIQRPYSEMEDTNACDNLTDKSDMNGGFDNNEHSQTIDPSTAQDILQNFTPEHCLQIASQVLENMRYHLFQDTGGLTCSAGLAPNFLLSKIASDKHKPNGQCLVGSSHAEVVAFLYPCKIRQVSGIGRVTEKILHAFGIDTVEKLYKERALVQFLFQPATASFLWRASLGCCSSSATTTAATVEGNEDTVDHQKGIGRERTFSSNSSWTFVHVKLEDIAHMLSLDMQQKQLVAHTITLKVKLLTFHVFSRSRTMPYGVVLHKAQDLLHHAAQLLQQIRKEFGSGTFAVRLIGIRCSNLEEAKDQPRSLMECWKKQKTLQQSPRIKDNTLTLDEATELEVTSSTSSAVRSTPSSTPHKTLPATPVHNNRDMVCPVCGRTVKTGSTSNADESAVYAALNRHLDVCLNASAIKEAIHQASTTTVTQEHDCRKRPIRRLTDFWSNQ